MRVGFDLDGVLYDFGNSVRRYLDSIGRPYGWKDEAPEPHHWDFYEYWGMDLAEFKQLCHDGVDAGYIFQGDIRPNAVESVRRVAELGHEIIIITDRQFGSKPENSHKATTEWLAQHGIEYDELVFSADKTCVPTDFFVEDKRENYDALRAAGVACYLITRPWNVDERYGLKDGRYRIDDISDYADTIELYTRLLSEDPSQDPKDYTLVPA